MHLRGGRHAAERWAYNSMLNTAKVSRMVVHPPVKAKVCGLDVNVYSITMMSVLDSPESRATVYPLSVEFYHEAGKLGLFGEDVELLEGVLFKKMPKSPLHETSTRRLLRLLSAYIPSGYFLTKESPITCTNSEPEPDIAVIAGSEEDFTHTHPTTAELIIEVAINTQQRDRSKAGIYAEAGVKEYWLVEPESKRLTLFTLPTVSGYGTERVFAETGHATSTIFPAFTVDLAEIFA